MKLEQYSNIFFIGIAGTGMSALAQYCAGIGINVSGSDRYFATNTTNDTKQKLQQCGIQCFAQDASGILPNTQLVIKSSAIENDNIEIEKANQLGITIITRSQLLTLICNTKKTIAVGGTSGKSTTTAMIFDILDFAGLQPSIISGAGLIKLQEQQLIGNAFVGKGDWLVIEADESDGSIVNYFAQIGLLLNIDKDHKEIDELTQIFNIFKSNSTQFIVNQGHSLAANFSQNFNNDFSAHNNNAGYIASNFIQDKFTMNFDINCVHFSMQSFGKHNMENALAAVCVANQCGVSLPVCSQALQNFKGIYRRNQILGNKKNVWVIDDFAHNPAKCAAAILGVQPLAQQVIAWFQPHGYAPTRFLRADFVEEISKALRPNDQIWMSEIYYAGGTAIKDISSNDLINDLQQKGCNAFFVEDRKNFAQQVQPHVHNNCIILLMGARDPSLADFAASFFENF
jgi:UDP-N-acetylmuramate--alanine ligase